MLTQTQRNAVFTNIGTSYTIEGHAYTAFKTWKDYWKGEIDTPVIVLYFKSQSRIKKSAIGRRAEWDTDLMAIDVFAQHDITNGVHGTDIAEAITQELELWFKESAAALLYSDGMSVGNTTQVQNLSFLENEVYRRYFEVSILYKLF